MLLKRLSFLFLFISAFGFAADHSVGFRIHRSDYKFSTEFDMNQDQHPEGSIVKSVFHVTTHYDLYDRYGIYEGQGVCRLFCLGALYVWGKEIDIYNADGQKMGLIDGQYATTEPAKFSFYDENGERLAIAYLDKNCTGFIIVDPENTSFILARLTRNFVEDTIDYWDTEIYFPEKLPVAMVKIFSAFAVDTQDKFKPDL
ncbi:MAG: hypothetical protein LW832_07765 [Parachlamydia sp.]|jgi:hypothetical protein|nr:hypothetical protein [Parachlamydia sp.]